jgi:hypothetical protein
MEIHEAGQQDTSRKQLMLKDAVGPEKHGVEFESRELLWGGDVCEAEEVDESDIIGIFDTEDVNKVSQPWRHHLSLILRLKCRVGFAILLELRATPREMRETIVARAGYKST